MSFAILPGFELFVGKLLISKIIPRVVTPAYNLIKLIGCTTPVFSYTGTGRYV